MSLQELNPEIRADNSDFLREFALIHAVYRLYERALSGTTRLDRQIFNTYFDQRLFGYIPSDEDRRTIEQLTDTDMRLTEENLALRGQLDDYSLSFYNRHMANKKFVSIVDISKEKGGFQVEVDPVYESEMKTFGSISGELTSIAPAAGTISLRFVERRFLPASKTIHVVRLVDDKEPFDALPLSVSFDS